VVSTPSNYADADKFCKNIGSTLHPRSPAPAIFFYSHNGIEPTQYSRNPYWVLQEPLLDRVHLVNRVESGVDVYLWGLIKIPWTRTVTDRIGYKVAIPANDLMITGNEIDVTTKLPFACKDSGNLDLISPYIKASVGLKLPGSKQPFQSNFPMPSNSTTTYCTPFKAHPSTDTQAVQQLDVKNGETPCFWINNKAVDKYSTPASGSMCYAVCQPDEAVIADWAIMRRLARRFFSDECDAQLRQNIQSCIATCPPLGRSIQTGALPTLQNCPCVQNLLNNQTISPIVIHDCLIRGIVLNYTSRYLDCSAMEECQDLAITGGRCSWVKDDGKGILNQISLCNQSNPNPDLDLNISQTAMYPAHLQNLKCQMRVKNCVELLDNSPCGFCDDEPSSDVNAMPLSMGRYGSVNGPLPVSKGDWEINHMETKLCKRWITNVLNCRKPPFQFFSW
jgi:hypothetical protein